MKIYGEIFTEELPQTIWARFYIRSASLSTQFHDFQYFHMAERTQVPDVFVCFDEENLWKISFWGVNSLWQK